MSLFSRLFSRLSGSSLRSIDVLELKQVFSDDPSAVVLDVRSPGELTGPDGVLPGAINIPINDLRSRVADLEPHRDRPIHVICASGSRSMVGAAMLTGAGFQAVNIKGGMSAWRRAFGRAAR